MIDISETIIRQYSNSPRLLRLLEDFRDNLDPATFYEMAMDNIFDPRTASGVGLDIWGRIVGVSRYIDVAADKYLGFAEAADLSADTWNNAIWYNGEGSGTGSIAITDEMFRKLIFAKAWTNQSDCSIPSINGCLQMLFSDSGRAYAVDNRDKSITFTFEFQPDAAQIAIIENSGVMPVPAGVSFSYEVETT